MCLETFLKVETEVDERTDSSKLIQREGAQELSDLEVIELVSFS